MKKLTLLTLLLLSMNLYSQTIDEMEFINRPIQDIAFALSKTAEINIIPDDTITGSTTFYFAGGTAQEAVDLFLNQNRLYLIKGDNHYKLSKIKIETGSSGLINLDADEVPNLILLKQLSSQTRKTILFDALPPDHVTLHVTELPIERILEMVITKHRDYYLEVLEGYYYIRYKPQEMKAREVVEDLPEGTIAGLNGEYSLNVDQESFRKLLMQFFKYTGKEFIFLGQNNSFIENLYTNRKSFDETLRILLEQGDSDYRMVGETYYIFDSQRREIIENYNSSALIRLENMAVESMMQLMPPAISSKAAIKIDNSSNTVLLYGSLSNINRVQEFIRKLDDELKGMSFHRFNLNFLESEKLQSLLPKSLKNVEIISIPETTAIVVSLTTDQVDEFESFLKLADVPGSTYEIRLKYLKAEEFIKALPPSIKKEEIITTQDDSLIFFKGEEEKYKALMEELTSIDRPKPQIRYDLLVIQYQENKKFNWDLDVGNSVISDDGVEESYLAKIGSILTLDFDTTEIFGYQFTLDLSADISQSVAKVMADSTLNALSGQQAKFRNTNTYRYRDTIKDSDTGDEEVTGVSREITSGLFIDLLGWVSGDDMITMDISTTFSKQESVSDNNEVGTLPPTSEKIIETHVRTPAGKPVIIGGLIQQEMTETVQKVPLLGSIPFLGYLFQHRQENYENTEMVIYIIPYIEQEPDGENTRLNRYRKKYGDLLAANE